ncbi:MAG: hypothetical protein ACYDBH_10365 [Acidobacteriaceae bacterium]
MIKRTTGDKFHFKIDGFTPETLPMSRLAEYMTDLAALLGHEHNVHFLKVARGSADLVHIIEETQQQEVIQRLHLVKEGLGPAEAQGAFRSLNAKLSEDGKTAKMMRGRGKLLAFPGIKATPPTYGPIYMQGHLDGQLIRVGGKDGTKPIHIMNDDAYYICNANAEVARELATAYEKFIRVYGNGKWFREPDGRWNLEHFNIKTFEFLDNAPLPEIIGRLRGLPNNEWKEIDDPLGELASLREREG